MRLGVSLDRPSDDPKVIALAYVEAGYAAAVCPKVSLGQPERVLAIREAFARQDVVIAKVSVWNNILDPDPTQRAANLAANVRALAWARWTIQLSHEN